jgi:hypothetical protein
MEWVRPAEMSYLSEDRFGYRVKRRPHALYTSYRYSGFSGLGAVEFEALDRLPKSLIQVLADEAEDPEFVEEYLIPTLRSPNPKEKILEDITTELVEAQRPGTMGDLGKKKGFFKKLTKIHKKLFHELPKKLVPKSVRKIAKKIGKPVMKVWHKYGNVIIGIAGSALALFTGGASLAAASVLIAAKNMYDAKKAADKAKREAKKEAGALNAQADQAQAQVASQVDDFYNQNQAWFLQYDMTPEKWAKLDLDHKLAFINAGANGQLPPGTTPTQLTADQATTQAQQTAAAAEDAGVPPSAVAPQGAPGQGYATSGGGAPGTAPTTGEAAGPPPEGYETVAEEEQAAEAKQAPAGNYEVMIEGQSAGKFTSFSDATKFAIDNTTRGDRFEIMLNGKSTGLRIRVSDGSIESPPGLEDKVRALDHDKMMVVVEQAEKEIAEYKAKNGGGGIPWWVILGGGAAALAVSR